MCGSMSRTLSRGFKDMKILESLSGTILLGIVLTVLMVIVINSL